MQPKFDLTLTQPKRFIAGAAESVFFGMVHYDPTLLNNKQLEIPDPGPKGIGFTGYANCGDKNQAKVAIWLLETGRFEIIVWPKRGVSPLDDGSYVYVYECDDEAGFSASEARAKLEAEFGRIALL